MQISEKYILELEALIRSGDLSVAAQRLANLSVKQIPRRYCARLGALANRVGRTAMTLKLLNPLVRGGRSKEEAATPEELIEYAEALRRLGATREAEQILSRLSHLQLPVVNLRWAYCLISQWRYREAIPRLQDYLNAVPTTEYSNVIARVNLAAALIFEQDHVYAEQILSSLHEETKTPGRELLHTNCLELKAQLEIFRGQWREAHLALDRAEATVATTKSHYNLYLQKWRAIALSLEQNRAHPSLVQVRQAAITAGSFETERECDLYLGVTGRDPALVQRVYFGTSQPSYRAKIEKLAAFCEFPDSYQTAGSPQVLDVLTARINGDANAIEEGELPHRLLILLARDFYRPATVLSAFSDLFPEEHFNPQGSANRVHQVTRRLRQALEPLPLRLVEKSGCYRLHCEDQLALRVRKDPIELSARAIEWREIEDQFPSHPFSKMDVVRLKNCSVATAKRWLRWAVDTGHAQVVGSGNQQRYKIVA